MTAPGGDAWEAKPRTISAVLCECPFNCRRSTRHAKRRWGICMLHPSGLIVEQALDRRADELRIFLADRRQASSMPPVGADWQQPCIAHLLYFEPVILDLEVKIGITGHDD